MNVQEKFEIREISTGDIEAIADYWLKSDQSFLLSLGVDLSKLPSRHDLTQMLIAQIQLPATEKSSFALIAEVNGVACGHCNVNPLTYGKEATMHLHLWKAHDRKKGLGSKMVFHSLPIFFERLKLETIWCEPYAKNPAPNRTLEKLGFEFEKKYLTVPGSLNFEQEVNRWKMTRDRFETIKNNRRIVSWLEGMN